LVPVEVYSTSPAMASSFSVDGRSSTTGGRSQRAQLCELVCPFYFVLLSCDIGFLVWPFTFVQLMSSCQIAM
jgi:hypothetical protein